MTKPEEVRELIAWLRERAFHTEKSGEENLDKAATTLDQLLRENEMLREALSRIETHYTDTCLAAKHMAAIARATLNQKDTSHE